MAGQRVEDTSGVGVVVVDALVTEVDVVVVDISDAAVVEGTVTLRGRFQW